MMDTPGYWRWYAVRKSTSVPFIVFLKHTRNVLHFLCSLRACSHRASASASDLTLRKGIIDFQLLYSDRVTLVLTLENDSQPIPSINADSAAAADAWCSHSLTFLILRVTKFYSQGDAFRMRSGSEFIYT